MFNRNKKTIVFALILLISISSVSYFIPKTESIDPFFTLVAKGWNTRHMDYLNLMKQQLARIGIHLKIELFNWSEISFLGYLVHLRDTDLFIWDIQDSWELDPFLSNFFSENGSENFISYRTIADWDEELGTGKNEWYIQNGLQMITNDSQEQINHCWEWQHYVMNELLPCLPLFKHKNNHSSYELLFYNVHEARPWIGSYDPAPAYTSKSKGLAVRKAISYAINREEIRRVVLGHDYEIIHHPTNPNQTEWLNPSSIRYCYNSDVARNFMCVAGFCVGLHDPKGYDVWPDWEEICPSQPTTISVVGLDLIATLSVLVVLPISFCIYKKKRSSSLRN